MIVLRAEIELEAGKIRLLALEIAFHGGDGRGHLRRGRAGFYAGDRRVSIRNAHMDEGVAAADAVAESSAERWRFSGGSDSETGSSGGTHVAPSERWRSGWDGEFESPLLQQRV